MRCYLDIVSDCRVLGSWISPLGLVCYRTLVVVHWWSYRQVSIAVAAVVVCLVGSVGSFPMLEVGIGFGSGQTCY
jgi:hypothetical protein